MKNDLRFWSTTNQPTNQQNNANFDRLMYASGNWVAGTYDPQEVVDHLGIAWRCLNQTTAEPSDASADWARMALPLLDVYTGAALVAIAGATPVVFSYDPVNSSPSELFTINAGNLQALVSGIFTFDMAVVWTPNTVGNDDAGLILQLEVRSGTPTFPIKDPFGSLFQSSRANSDPMGASHTLGMANMVAGDVIGVDANNYTGQSGTTDMASLHLYVSISAVS